MPRSPEAPRRTRTAGTSRWLALGVALPTLLLALGWGLATVRERELREDAERVQIEAMLGSLEQAIDESLEELRAREDERPYYLWGHYYSPPDVISVTDSVAISPLASGPGDPRVIGHFQLAADGRITTPYAEGPLDGREPRAPREERLRTLLVPEVRRALGAVLASEPHDTTLVTAEDDAEATGELASSSLTSRETVAEVGPEDRRVRNPWSPREGRAPQPSDAPQQRVQALELNTYGSQLAQEIEQAQAGDPVALGNLWERGRATPQVSRRVRSGGEPASASPRTRPATTRTLDPSPIPRVATGSPTTESPGSVSPATESPSPLSPSLPTPIEIDYTPMHLERLGGSLVLVRTVSDGGSSFLQGVALDEEHLSSSWLPRLVARFVVSEPAARLLRVEDTSDCAIRRPLTRFAPDQAVCIDAAALRPARGGLLTFVERGLLVGLVAIVVLALMAVRRAAREEEALSREKSQFVSAVSHELRTPLTTIRMHAEMLADDLVEPERRPRVHEELVSETVRLTRLVENVLEASRLEEGRRPVRPRRGDLRAHVAAIVSDVTRFARGRGFELALSDDETPLECAFDAGAIEQVVVNLIDNAIKYTGEGERRIEIEVTTDGASARITVQDHGVGIPEPEKARVFERFHRIERAEQAHQPGTGLGLAIVRELVRAHGGDVTLRDRVPRGLEVVVTLPLGTSHIPLADA